MAAEKYEDKTKNAAAAAALLGLLLVLLLLVLILLLKWEALEYLIKSVLAG